MKTRNQQSPPAEKENQRKPAPLKYAVPDQLEAVSQPDECANGTHPFAQSVTCLNPRERAVEDLRNRPFTFHVHRLKERDLFRR